MKKIILALSLLFIATPLIAETYSWWVMNGTTPTYRVMNKDMIIKEVGTSTSSASNIFLLSTGTVRAKSLEATAGVVFPDGTRQTTAAGAGGGDMNQSVYDTNSNNIVDNAEQLNSQPASYYAIASDVRNSTSTLRTEVNALHISTGQINAISLSGKTTTQLLTPSNMLSGSLPADVIASSFPVSAVFKNITAQSLSMTVDISGNELETISGYFSDKLRVDGTIDFRGNHLNTETYNYGISFATASGNGAQITNLNPANISAGSLNSVESLTASSATVPIIHSNSGTKITGYSRWSGSAVENGELTYGSNLADQGLLSYDDSTGIFYIGNTYDTVGTVMRFFSRLNSGTTIYPMTISGNGNISMLGALTVGSYTTPITTVAVNAVQNSAIAGSGTRDSTTFYRGDGTFAVPSAGSVAAGDITAGQVDDDVQVTTASLKATGTPSASTYLRGDGSWTEPSGTGDMVKATDGVSIANSTSTLRTEINQLHIDTGTIVTTHNTDKNAIAVSTTAIASTHVTDINNIATSTAALRTEVNALHLSTGLINAANIQGGVLPATVIASSIAINSINNTHIAACTLDTDVIITSAAIASIATNCIKSGTLSNTIIISSIQAGTMITAPSVAAGTLGASVIASSLSVTAVTPSNVIKATYDISVTTSGNCTGNATTATTGKNVNWSGVLIVGTTSTFITTYATRTVSGIADTSITISSFTVTRVGGSTATIRLYICALNNVATFTVASSTPIWGTSVTIGTTATGSGMSNTTMGAGDVIVAVVDTIGGLVTDLIFRTTGSR